MGALVAGVETEIRAYVLNGVGAYLSITAVEVSTPVDYNAMFQLLLGVDERLDRFNPVISLIQLGAEVVDPINYARYWRGWETHRAGSSLYLINGVHDDYTPVGTMNSITICGGVQPIDPPGWDVDPFDVWDLEPAPLPLSGNTESVSGNPLTIATYLSPTEGHFTIYDVPEARALAVEFWLSALEGAPVLGE